MNSKEISQQLSKIADELDSSQALKQSKKLPKNLTEDMILDAVERDDNLGYCISCGEEAFGVEPDARSYTCEVCESPSVYGAEELLFMLG
jgi:hypothetical protein